MGVSLALVAVIVECACAQAPTASRLMSSEAQPGGATTFAPGALATFVKPAQNLSIVNKPGFYAGKALAEQPWVRAPSSTQARDGLGPLYNARSCMACHVAGGRGASPSKPVAELFATVVRLSIPGDAGVGGVVPEPTYGDQLQTRSVSLEHVLGSVPARSAARALWLVPEGKPEVTWVEQTHHYPDGAAVSLRKPLLRLRNLGYGPLHPQAQLGLRHAPALSGVGLLARVPSSHLERAADPKDLDGDGISGRVNRVWSVEHQALMPGRFGLKANHPTLKSQVAAALNADLGISSELFPNQPCTDAQPDCQAGPHGPDTTGHEISETLLELMTDFVRSIGVPARRRFRDPTIRRGRVQFYGAGCNGCHTPQHKTVADANHPHLSRQVIWPYTDLLLHDMGPDLAEGGSHYQASGAEWRTPPLWGVGLARSVSPHPGFLHDGRARTLEEAILWHGGEAASSRDHFTRLPATERAALLAFVRSL